MESLLIDLPIDTGLPLCYRLHDPNMKTSYRAGLAFLRGNGCNKTLASAWQRGYRADEAILDLSPYQSSDDCFLPLGVVSANI